MRTSILKAMAGRLQNAGRDESGAAAIIFAAALVLLAPLTLGVFDLYIASNQKQKLQDALDAAALYAARSAAKTPEEINEIGQKALAANLSSFNGSALITSNFRLDGYKVVGSAEMEPMALSTGFFEHGNVKAASEVLRAMDRLEIALVLDNTGSMAGTKLSTLKSAAKDLVDKLEAAGARSAVTDPIRISLVPFSNTVRVSDSVSMKNYNPKTGKGPGVPLWIDPVGVAHADAKLSIFTPRKTDRFELLKEMKGGSKSWRGCVESRRQPYDVNDTAPNPTDMASYFVPYFWPDEPDKGDGYWWSGNDYIDDHDNGNREIRQSNTTKYEKDSYSGDGPNKGCGLQPVMRLTDDVDDLKDAIDDMKAEGETNIPMGLVWGWHTLSPNAPFSDGVAYGKPNHRKIVILMTDGDNVNTASGYNPNGSNYSGLGYIWQGLLGITSGSSSERTQKMNDRLALLCSNMKAKDIVIYAVRVEVQSGDSELLRNCATDPEKFYDVQNVAQLGAAFDAIAGSIDNLRITK